MKKNNIRSYIGQQLEKKTSKEVIFENLKKAGWNDIDIEIAYEKALKANEANQVGSIKESKNPKDISGDGYAIASFVLGICGIFSVIFPVIAVVGLVLGILSIKKTSHHAKAVWGIVLSSLSLLLGIVVWTVFIFFSLSYGGLGYGGLGHSRYFDHESDSNFSDTRVHSSSAVDDLGSVPSDGLNDNPSDPSAQDSSY